MILSIAHATVDNPEAEHVYGAWSNIVVGDRPSGLVDCYLSRGDNTVYMISVWNTAEDHDRALADEASHPAFGFFEACGVDPTHATYQVIGRLASG